MTARLVALAAIGAVLVMIPLTGGPVLVLRATEIFAFIVAFSGLHVLSGRLGLISIGHGAFMGIGALAGAHAVQDASVPYLLAPVMAAAFAAAFGALIAVPSLRLPSTYLALLSVAVAMALPILMRRIDGPLGILVKKDLLPPAWTGLDSSQDEIWQYLLVVTAGSLIVGLMSLLLSGRFGRSLIAVRDEPTAAAAFGVNTPRTRILGVALACGLAGFAGGLLVYATPYVSGDRYTFELSLFMFALSVGFGSGRLWTSIPAAIVLVMLPEVLVSIGWSAYQPVVYGLLLLVATRLTGTRRMIDRLAVRRSAQPASNTEPSVVLLDA